MDELQGFDIRYTYITDTPYLRGWLNNPQVQKWFPVSEEKEIDDAVQCWIGFSRYSSSLTATINGCSLRHWYFIFNALSESCSPMPLQTGCRSKISEKRDWILSSEKFKALGKKLFSSGANEY